MTTYRSLSGWCTKSKPFNALKWIKKSRITLLHRRQIAISHTYAFIHTTKEQNYEHNSHCKRTLNALFWLCLILHVITLYHSVSLFYVQFYLCVTFIRIYSVWFEHRVSGGKKYWKAQYEQTKQRMCVSFIRHDI